MSVFSTQVQPYTQAQPYSMSVGCSPATLTAGQSGSCVIHVLGGATGSVPSFVGSQVPVTVDEQTFYIDLLFYHVRLHRYFVFELKVGAFQPEHAGYGKPDVMKSAA